ncbi:LysR family transcriptional regulator [Photobacterium kasasachensis]|uniref:LysR family transcriptional regulator n=1 Tax=Photobacterium kasasachensis TaxID=2910240 RepID=UPI003D108069
MSGINWRGVDLNLLLTFEAIMVCRSVSGASEQLHLGQPATSYNLKRLRTLLNDPLFERQGNTMVPTSRALELAPKIDAVISIIRDDILQPVAFEPKDFSDKIVIGLTDYAEQVFGPALFDSLISAAPNCQILFQAVDSANCEQALDSGEVDLAIGVFKQQPDHLCRTFLYRERHVCLFDNTVLQTELPISLEAYLATPQVVVSANKALFSPVDNTLSEMGAQRRVVLGSTRFLTLRHLISGRRLLCVMAEMVGRSELFNDDITLCEPPISIPDFDIDMMSRQRDSQHPRMQWLSEQVKIVIQDEVERIRGKQ